jgi:SecY interacting protein Syd
MTSSNHVKTDLVETLQQFANQFLRKHQELHLNFPKIEQDEQWPSPCEIFNDSNEVDKLGLLPGEVYWQPVTIEKEMLNFDNVESALEMTLHSDIKTYFTTLYSETLDANCEEGNLSLLFAWNKDDFLRLQENLIGHILMKQRLKQAETIFFAVTDEEDMIISIDNNTGEVWVERVGCKPHKKLADSLVQFIKQLTPIII